MRNIKNMDGKLVCKVDEKNGLVEIVYKGCKTMIRFKPDGTVEIANTKTAA